MGIAPIGGIGAVMAPIASIAVQQISAANSSAANPAASAQINAIGAASGTYLVSGTAQASGTSQLDNDLMKAALLLALLSDDSDEKKKSSPLLDALVAAAAIKLYEQIAALGTTSAVGFVGDGAGGAVGVSVSVGA